jgi:hypothetical protein
MSRRSGQSGTLIQQTGWWRVRFRLDQPGTDGRKHMSVKVAPVSIRLSKPELERRAKEIVQNAGANSEERFNRVVLGDVTFREQAKIYLQTAVSRKRNPLRDTVSIEGAMTKWIYPAIGELPLGFVDNLAVKPLPRFVKMKLDEKGMGWHSFKRFRKTWLRGARCLEDINNFWMAHKPKTMSEVYSHLHEELQLRLDEAERVGYGFTIPRSVDVVPSVPRFSERESIEIAA